MDHASIITDAGSYGEVKNSGIMMADLERFCGELDRSVYCERRFQHGGDIVNPLVVDLQEHGDD
jgi:hypothetical protein